MHRRIFQQSPRARRGCTGKHTSVLGCYSHSTCGCGAPQVPVSLGLQCGCWGCSDCARLLAFLPCHCGYGRFASALGRLRASCIAGIQCCCEQAQQPPNNGPCKHLFLTHFSCLSSSFPPVHSGLSAASGCSNPRVTSTQHWGEESLWQPVITLSAFGNNAQDAVGKHTCCCRMVRAGQLPEGHMHPSDR